MKTPALFMFALSCHIGLIAQDKTSVLVRAGTKVRDALATADVFHYPEFTNGKVFFRDGSQAEAKLNYSRLGDEMHFIDPRGDTLALVNENNIRFISIRGDTFYYDQGYVRLITSNNVMKLAVKQIWTVGDTRKIGAYNMANPASSIDSYKSFNDGGRVYNLLVNEDVLLKKGEYYYFGDQYNRFVVAGKKNLLKLLPKLERRIDAYLKENNIDFNNAEHLQKVVQFVEHLRP